MPKISRHSYDIAVVAVRRDHTSGVSVLKVYRPWPGSTLEIVVKHISLYVSFSLEANFDHRNYLALSLPK